VVSATRLHVCVLFTSEEQMLLCAIVFPSTVNWDKESSVTVLLQKVGGGNMYLCVRVDMS
jgi:hypothetical protein